MIWTSWKRSTDRVVPRCGLGTEVLRVHNSLQHGVHNWRGANDTMQDSTQIDLNQISRARNPESNQDSLLNASEAGAELVIKILSDIAVDTASSIHQLARTYVIIIKL